MSSLAQRIWRRIGYHASLGFTNLLFSLKTRALGHRLRMVAAHREAFVGRGLEIGGASRIFSASGAIPVYQIAHGIDNVTFSDRTRWEGRVEAGDTFVFDVGKPPGRQYIAEARDLAAIPDETYDFVISSHMLEHSANPIAVLNEWKRVVRTSGALMLVLPHRDGSFDRFRPITPLSHLIEDERGRTDESDTTHLSEILQLHDFARDPTSYSGRQFRAMIEENAKNRGAHHHVFDALSVARLLDYAGWEIVEMELMRPFNICALARKTAPAAVPHNEAFLRGDAEYLRASPFATDRAQLRAGR